MPDRRVSLTTKQVLEIRRRYAKGLSMPRLAREYGVSKGAVQEIVEEETWKHAPAVLPRTRIDKRNRPATRLLRVLRALLSSTVDIDALAEQLGESRKTIYGDMHALQAAGVAIDETRGRYRADRVTVLAALGFVETAPFVVP